MRKTGFVQPGIEVDDFVVDPRVLARIGAAGHDGAEGAVKGDAVRRLAYRALQAFGHMQTSDGQDAAHLRIIPFQNFAAAAARHREHADGIGMEQQFRRDVGVTLRQGFSQA